MIRTRKIFPPDEKLDIFDRIVGKPGIDAPVGSHLNNLGLP